MRKHTIWMALALTVALSACAGPETGESKAPATAAPTAAATAVQTQKPAAPTAAEPAATPTPEPAATPAATPAPTSKPTAAVEQSRAPVIHAIETLPPEESIAPPPAPTESLCALPPAPTPGAEATPEPPESEPPAVPTDVVPDVEPARPTDEEVRSAYLRAYEAYEWFHVITLPLDYSVTHMVGEYPYNPVSDERFPTLDALRGYLKTLFSDEIVDELLPMDGVHYRDIDGVLCAMDGARGTNIFAGGESMEVLWDSEDNVTNCVVRVRVEKLDENDLTTVVGEEVYDYPYQKVGDKWVFTWFTTTR